MKIIIKLMIICFMLLSLKVNGESANNQMENEDNINHHQLSFLYSNLHIEANQLVLTGYLTNGYEQAVYPRNLYLKIYDDKIVYVEDTFLFSSNFFINSLEVKIVTIRFLLRDDLPIQNVSSLNVYYQYNFLESY